jgi:uncharacterized protein YbcI
VNSPAERTGRGTAQGQRLASISTSMVSLHRRYYGKGPTEAKTFVVDDTVLCILRGGFTTVEETLMADGKGNEVESMRRSFQRTMEARFTEAVESALDREVIGYLSQILVDPPVAIELFLLEPQSDGSDGTGPAV